MSEAPSGIVICPVLPWPAHGGAEKRTLRLLEAMDTAGVRPHLLTADPRQQAADGLLERGWGVDVLPAPEPTLRARLAQHAHRRPSPYLPAVADRLRGLPGVPALVQVEHVMSSYYAPDLESAPLVLSTHNVDSEMLTTVARGHRRGSVEWLRGMNRARSTAATERKAARWADVVLCVSEHDREHFARLGAETLLVPNGVDDDLLTLGEPPGGERVLFFGRMDYAPNDHGLRRFLAEVWPRVAASRPAATLRVVGGGLGEQLAAELRAAPRAEAVGLVPEIRAELGAADVVVVPIWQGGGTRLKVLEALGAGRAVVGTPLGVSGIGVQDGVHAAVTDDAAGLGAALERVLGDPAAARGLAARGRELARGFLWSATTAPAAEHYARWAHAARP